MAPSPTTPDVSDTGPSSSLGRPGPRWDGDGALGPPPVEARLRADGPVDAGTGVEYASFWRRGAAYLLDELGKTLIWLPIITVFMLLTGGSTTSPDPNDPLALLPRILLGLGYDWIFWTQGWTPGAAAMEIRITDAAGRPPGPGRAAIRVLGAIVSGMAFLVGYAWMLRSSRRQTWHDIMAGTVVVRVAPEERRATQRDRRD